MTKTRIPRTETEPQKGISVRRIDPSSEEGRLIAASLLEDQSRKSQPTLVKRAMSSWQEARKAPGQLEHNRKLLEEDAERQRKEKEMAQLEQLNQAVESLTQMASQSFQALKVDLQKIGKSSQDMESQFNQEMETISSKMSKLRKENSKLRDSLAEEESKNSAMREAVLKQDELFGTIVEQMNLFSTEMNRIRNLFDGETVEPEEEPAPEDVPRKLEDLLPPIDFETYLGDLDKAREDEQFWSRIRVEGMCWTWDTPAKAPRIVAEIHKVRKSRSARAHAYALAKGEEASASLGMACQNPRCCNPNHTYLNVSGATRLANAAYALSQGEITFEQATSGLTPEETTTIRVIREGLTRGG